VLGDVNGDGRDELAVGSPLDSTGFLDVISIDPPLPIAMSATPQRGPFHGGRAIQVVGERFALNAPIDVLFDDSFATDVQILDDATVSCTLPSGLAGPADVTVSGYFGDAALSGAFHYNPELIPEGDFTPGGRLILRYLVEPLDSIFAIVGVPPPVSISTPPYVGWLEILPFYVLFTAYSWPFDELVLDVEIPDDPSLSGVDLLFQSLAGPELTGRGKLAAWSQSALVQIR
jgi:hypothetical protein